MNELVCGGDIPENNGLNQSDHNSRLDLLKVSKAGGAGVTQNAAGTNHFDVLVSGKEVD